MPTKGNLILKSSLDFYLNRITENNFNLIKMLHYKDDQYLFINGRSINYIFVNLIPRIFWSNKPSASFGNEFGQKFRHLSKKNISTSINISWLNEFYWNYKTKGIIIGAIILALIFAFIEKFSNNNNPLQYLVLLASISFILIPESNMALYVAISIKSFILLYILSFIINTVLGIKKNDFNN